MHISRSIEGQTLGKASLYAITIETLCIYSGLPLQLNYRDLCMDFKSIYEE